jgi:hypothetical protein
MSKVLNISVVVTFLFVDLVLAIREKCIGGAISAIFVSLDSDQD